MQEPVIGNDVVVHVVGVLTAGFVVDPDVGGRDTRCVAFLVGRDGFRRLQELAVPVQEVRHPRLECLGVEVELAAGNSVGDEIVVLDIIPRTVDVANVFFAGETVVFLQSSVRGLRKARDGRVVQPVLKELAHGLLSPQVGNPELAPRHLLALVGDGRPDRRDEVFVANRREEPSEERPLARRGVANPVVDLVQELVDVQLVVLRPL